LKKLLNSLSTQEGVQDVSIEVFVADNDPAGSEAAAVCNELAPGFRWPLTGNIVEEPGISAARNAILDQGRRRRSDFIVMLDDDEVAAPSWLSELLRMQAHTGADLIGGPVLPIFEIDVSATLRSSPYFTRPIRSDGLSAAFDAAGNVLICCVSLSKIGWPKFDLRFGLTGGEDKEYFARLRDAGLRFAWCSRAIAYEYVPSHRSTLGWALRRAFRVGSNDIRTAKLHDGRVAATVSIAKALVIIGTAPVSAFLLLSSSRRLWILEKWSRSLGKLTALFGYRSVGYGRNESGASS
jgi:glycosyltransferase involved in cell wall biosynthesis